MAACFLRSLMLVHVTLFGHAIGRTLPYTCEEKRSCRSNLTNEKHRTCWCDAACRRYAQCCHDYEPSPELDGPPEDDDDDKQWELVRERVKCRHFPPVSSRPLYIVTDCPDSSPADVIRSRCEDAALGPPVNDPDRLLVAKRSKTKKPLIKRLEKTPTHTPYNYLNHIPVSSLMTGVVYRNAFCALCNDEYRFVFFDLEVFSRAEFGAGELNDASSVRRRLQEAQLHRKYRYRPPGALPARSCIPTVSRCPATWPDDVTAARCAGPTALMLDYVTGSVYRNVHCALCNHVDVRTLRCEGRASLVTLEYPAAPRYPLPYSLLIDVNTGILRAGSADVGYVEVAAGAEVLPVCQGLAIPGRNRSADVALASLVDDGSCDRPSCPEGYEYDGARATCARREASAFKFGAGLGYLTLVGNCLSMIALSVLLAVYAAVRCLRNTPGKCLMSLSSSLLLAQLLFTTAADKTDHVVVCPAVGVAEHYLLLAYSLWMNVMSVDVWRAFRRRSPALPASPTSGRGTFAAYSCYAWLAPLPLVTWSTLADVFELGVRPRYGEHFCWIGDRGALLWFFGVPLGCVVLANSALFLVTLRNIRVASRGTSALRRSTNAASDRCRFLLYVKLAVVMALTWLFGFLATLIDHVTLWYVFTAANAFQGVYICLAFVFTRKVYANTVLKIRRLASSRSRTYSGSATRETNDGRTSSTTRSSSRIGSRPETGDI